MKTKLFCGVAGLALSVILGVPTAKAADPVVDTCGDWSGSYLGIHAGYGEADFTSYPHGGETDDGVAETNPNGFLGGLHGGHNWQSNCFVLGLEGDASLMDWSDSDTFSNNDSRSAENDVNLLASLRLRLGMSLDQALIFATGGLAYADGDFLAISPGGTRTSANFSSFGGVVGGGAEFRFADNWSVRAEGLYYFFDDREEASGTETPGNRSEFDDALVGRIGATFHFGGI